MVLLHFVLLLVPLAFQPHTATAEATNPIVECRTLRAFWEGRSTSLQSEAVTSVVSSCSFFRALVHDCFTPCFVLPVGSLWRPQPHTAIAEGANPIVGCRIP